MSINAPSAVIRIIDTFIDYIKRLQERPIIIAIDGHSSCGKSTLSKDLAKVLDYTHIDTGAMYRGVTLYLIQQEIDITNNDEVSKALHHVDISFAKIGENSHLLLNGVDVEKDIRGLAVASKVSPVAAISSVRRFLVDQQQKMGHTKGIVMDGRDIGSVVFPDAELKIFMTADSEVRANRRYEEMQSKGSKNTFEQVLANLKKRDLIDSTRSDSPLVKVDDAKVIDTTSLSREDQLRQAMELAITLLS